MKSVLKRVKQRVLTEGGKEDTTQNSNFTNHIENKALSRCRASRIVSRKVLSHGLPSLHDSPQDARAALLIRKARLCSYIFTFSKTVPDSPDVAKDKELKRLTLLELTNYVTVFKPAFTEAELEELFEMISFNIFRPLPPTTLESIGMYNPEEDEPMSDLAWPHLQVVYEFILRLAGSTETEPTLMQQFLSRPFILKFLQLFDSEDPRERDYLKTILHRIYGNFMPLRPYIRRSIHNECYRFMYESYRHNGIAELLEILGSIINGFAVPIKEQHTSFLKSVLIPLHKVRYLSVFHPQLSYCITQFLEKDSTLAPVVIMGLIKYWPVTDSKKELMFLNELEEILDRIHSSDLQHAQIPLFQQIANSIASPHFQVSERAIYVLSNDVILRFVTNSRQTLVPILASALYSNTYTVMRSGGEEEPWRKQQRWQDRGHWNQTIVELTQDILKLFHEMDSPLMIDTETQHVPNLKAQVLAGANRAAQLEQMHRQRQTDKEVKKN